MVEDKHYNASGVEPTIELPPGSHTIQLRVNDGADISLPDTMAVDVVDPIIGELYTYPSQLYQKGGGNRFNAFLFLPEVTNNSEIELESFALYPGGIVPKKVSSQSLGSGTIILYEFNKKKVLEGFSEYGMHDITLAGTMNSGQSVYGSGQINIEHKRKGNNGKKN
jgi:hypothetical protein